MRRTSIGRLGVVLGFVFAFLLAVPEARADRATEMKAREAFASGRYDDALGLFAKLYAETLHPVYLRNIGRCHQKMRQPEKAIDKFREYLAKEKKISADERKEIDGYIKEMEALQEEQARQATPPPPANPPPPVTPIQPTSPPPPPNYYAAQPPPPTTTSSATLVSQPPPRAGSADLQEVVVLDGHRRRGRGRGRWRRSLITQSGGTTRPECTASGGCM